MNDANAILFAGVGASAIERRSDRGLLAFALDAALEAIADAGLTRDDIDGYVGAPAATNPGALHAEGGDEVSARSVVEALGVPSLAWGVDLYKGFATDMVIAAAHALRSGACRAVLGVRALYNPQGVAYATAQALQMPQAWGDDQFRAPFGWRAGGARFATRAHAYMARTGATRRDLYEVVALSRRHAALNPHAIWKDRTVSLDDYLAAPMVSTPLCLFDCDMPVCGAGAFVMTRADFAPATGRAPVYLAGSAGWGSPHHIYRNARRTPADIGCAQIYDGFSSMVFEWLERLNFAPEDRGWRFVRDGGCERDGRAPLNTFGGSLGEGRLHGIGHLREAVLQVGGRAGARQAPRSDNCIVQVGTFDFSSLLVLSASP